MHCVDVIFASGRYFDVDDAVIVVDSPSEAAEAWHVDVCVEDGEEGELGEQQESGNDVVCDLGVHSNAEVGQGALEREEEENTV